MSDEAAEPEGTVKGIALTKADSELVEGEFTAAKAR
jgi:hypothetical protein